MLVCRGTSVGMAGGAGWDCVAGHAASAGTNTLWGRSAIVDRGMWANRVVVTSPALDDDLGFARRAIDIAQTGIEAFNQAILPGLPGVMYADHGQSCVPTVGWLRSESYDLSGIG